MASNKHFGEYLSVLRKNGRIDYTGHVLQYQFRKSFADSTLTYLYDYHLRNHQPWR